MDASSKAERGDICRREIAAEVRVQCHNLERIGDIASRWTPPGSPTREHQARRGVWRTGFPPRGSPPGREPFTGDPRRGWGGQDGAGGIPDRAVSAMISSRTWISTGPASTVSSSAHAVPASPSPLNRAIKRRTVADGSPAAPRSGLPAARAATPAPSPPARPGATSPAGRPAAARRHRPGSWRQPRSNTWRGWCQRPVTRQPHPR